MQTEPHEQTYATLANYRDAGDPDRWPYLVGALSALIGMAMDDLDAGALYDARKRLVTAQRMRAVATGEEDR